MNLLLGTLFGLLISHRALASTTHNDGSITRCFDKNSVRVTCRLEQNLDSKKIDGEIEITAHDSSGHIYSYVYGKILAASVCHKDTLSIKKLVHNVKTVCLTGYGENQVSSNESAAWWKSIRTARGLHER